MTIQANQGPGVSIFGATSAGGGGGSTSPGGSSGQVQYNNGGSFGGMSGTSWDDTNRALTLTGATVTTSQPVLNLSQTWNAGAVTFTGLKFNAATGSNANSASASLLLDLQLEGSSKVYVTKAGQIYTAIGQIAVPGALQINSGNTNDLRALTASTIYGTAFQIGSGITPDVYLSRAAAATLQLGSADAAAPVAQTLQVQSVVAGTSNTAGTNWTLKGSAGTGTGAGGSIIFQVAPAGSSGTAQNAYSTALTIETSGSVTRALIAGATGGSTSLGITSFNIGLAVYSNSHLLFQVGGLNRAGVTANGLQVPSDKAVTWDSATNSIGGADVFLARDAANTLALRNGLAGQTFNVYDTYTDATNYRRATLSNGGGAGVILSLNGASTGNSGSLYLRASVTGGTLEFGTASTDRWRIDASGHFLAIADNLYDIGATSSGRPRTIYVGGGASIIAAGDIRSSGNFALTGKAILASGSSGNLILYNGTATDFSLLQFGGTTSSFPALKRISSGNCLQVIAADNTASAGFIVGNQALATTATDGFLYIPTCAGTPTGVPTTQTGTAPIVVDTTNNKLYFYSGGAWRDAGP